MNVQFVTLGQIDAHLLVLALQPSLIEEIRVN